MNGNDHSAGGRTGKLRLLAETIRELTPGDLRTAQGANASVAGLACVGTFGLIPSQVSLPVICDQTSCTGIRAGWDGEGIFVEAGVDGVAVLEIHQRI